MKTAESIYFMKLETNRKSWEHYFKQATFANLLQSWSYGDAKAQADGYIVHRGVILKNGFPVALCQWLEKSALRFIKIIRINRGPIWLNSEPDVSEKLYIHQFLEKYFSICKGNFLFIAPALENNNENKAILKKLGYKKRKKFIPWKSALVNLTKTPEELRAALQSRLRNYLKRAENENHIFEYSTKKEDFVNLITRYVQLQKEKKFTGVSVEYIKSLYNSDQHDKNAFIVRTKDINGQLMAEKFLVIHGNQCTPLIAWTSHDGLKCHAMHFLMWKTLLYLKDRGVTYFDVGGYNEEEHASVSQFKKGFGGQEYSLIGEYRGFF